MRTKNNFKTKNKFKSKAKWVDKSGPYFVIPGIMIEKNLDVGIDVTIDRITVAIGYKRWRWDTGTYTPLPTGEISWSKAGVEDFSKWAKKQYNKKWGRAEIESVIKDKNYIKDIILETGLYRHYNRILIAREIIEKESENSFSSSANNDKAFKGATGNTRNLINALDKHLEDENKKIDPLDQLGNKIMSSSQETTRYEE